MARPGYAPTAADRRAMANPSDDAWLHTLNAGTFTFIGGFLTFGIVSVVTRSPALGVLAAGLVLLAGSAWTAITAVKSRSRRRRRAELRARRDMLATTADPRVSATSRSKVTNVPPAKHALIDATRDKALRLQTALAADVLSELDRVQWQLAAITADVDDLMRQPWEAMTMLQRRERVAAYAKAAKAVEMLNSQAEALADSTEQALMHEASAPTDAIAALNARVSSVLSPDPAVEAPSARQLLSEYNRVLGSLEKP